MRRGFPERAVRQEAKVEHRRAEPLPRHRNPRPAIEGVDRPENRRRIPRYRQHHAGLCGAGRRRHRRGRRRQPTHRPRFGDRRDHDRQFLAARRRGRARAGRRLHPHLLHDHAVRGVRRRRRTSQPPYAGELREAFGAVQLRVGGGGERGQDRQDIHPQAGGGGVRPRLPRPHQPDDGPDREVDALQARLRPVRPGDLPRAAVLSVPRRRVRQGDGDRR